MWMNGKKRGQFYTSTRKPVIFQQFGVREEICRFMLTSCRARKCAVRRRHVFGPAESGGILIDVKRSAWHCCSFTHPQGACSDFNHQPRRNHPQTNRGRKKTSWTILFVMDAFSFGSAQSTWPQRRIKLPVADYFIGFLLWLPESLAIPNRIVRA